jgi:hypothetical protein
MKLIWKRIKGSKGLELVSALAIKPSDGSKIVDCGRYGRLRVYPDGSYTFVQ